MCQSAVARSPAARAIGRRSPRARADLPRRPVRRGSAAPRRGASRSARRSRRPGRRPALRPTRDLACLSARRAFGSESYAPSRIRAWRNENSCSPEKLERIVRDDQLLHAEAASASRTTRVARPDSCGDRAEPEHAPDHGRVLEHGLLVVRKTVQPCRDQSLDRTRELHVGDRRTPPPSATLPWRGGRRGRSAPDDLLGVERVALAPLDDQLPELVGDLSRRGGRRSSRRLSSAVSGSR